MARSFNYRPVGSTAAPLYATGNLPITVPAAAGPWEVDVGDGVWRPVTVGSTSTPTPTPTPGTLFFDETFTVASPTAMSEKTADFGTGYSNVLSTLLAASASGRMICNATAHNLVQQNTPCPTAKVSVLSDVVQATNNGGAFGIGLRCTDGQFDGIYARGYTSSNELRIVRTVAGTSTTLTSIPRVWATGDTYRVTADTEGTSVIITVEINGTQVAIPLASAANVTTRNGGLELVDADPSARLTGRFIHLANLIQPTSATVGTTLDRVRAYSF